MNHQIIPARKIVQPRLSPTIMHRAPLVETLRQSIEEPSSICKLILLCAPAGYGKTTLLADFATHSGVRCCWYFCDSSDQDIATFVATLLASIRQHFPLFGQELDNWLAHSAEFLNAGDEHYLGLFVNKFVAACEERVAERFAIFLCNYHEVGQNERINLLVNRLLDYLPQHCVIAIESRAVPALELVSLLSRYQMISIGSGTLSLSTQEIQVLAEILHVEPLSAEEASRLREDFDGWVAGLLLGTRLGRASLLTSPGIFRGPTIRLDRQNLFAYLVKEVFKQEPEVYAFLKEMSILQKMTPALCDTLLKTRNSEKQLNYIEQHGLFVTRAESEKETIYICHPVLHDLLYTELCQQTPARARELHQHAIALHQAFQDYDQAIFHAYAAGDNERAAQLILESARSLFVKGQIKTLATWIDALPACILERSFLLLLHRSNIHLALKEVSQALELLAKARTLLEEDSIVGEPDLLPSLKAELLVIESVAWFDSGDYPRTQQLCQEALTMLSEDEVDLRAKAYQRLGMCASLLNDSSSGILYMQQALHLWGHQRERLETALLHGYLANAYNMIGNYILAEHHRTRAIDSCTRLGNTGGYINNLIGMAITKRYKGILEEAEKLLNEALTLARKINFHQGEAYALENLGEIYLEQDLFSQALVVTEDALALARQLKDRYLENHVLCTLALIYLLMGDTSTASLLVARTNVGAGIVASYEYALREMIRGTVLFFQGFYQEAYTCLNALEQPLQKAGLQRLSIHTSIRIAACLFCLNKIDEMIQTLMKQVDVVRQGNHEHLVRVELRRFPQLRQALQLLPQTAGLRAIWLSFFSSEPETVTPLAVEEVSVREETSLRMLAFGEPAVLVNGIPVTRWRMARSMELYFMLLDAGHPLRKEQIMEALWPEPDEQSDQTLRSTIFYLRKAVGESCIIYNTGSYLLDLASLYGNHVWYDVDLFQKHYTQAKERLDAEDDEGGWQAFHNAVELYRGDYVQAFYSDWCNERRDKLRRMYLEMCRQLALLAMKRENFEESVTHWQRILAVDNCLESAHYGIMRCYLHQGKRGMALRQYQRCAEILQQELSVSPGSALRKLHMQIRDKN